MSSMQVHSALVDQTLGSSGADCKQG